MTFRSAFLIVLATAASAQAAAVTLTDTSYTKNFAPSEATLATGFEAYAGATATLIGTASPVISDTSNSTTAGFRLLTDNSGGFAVRPSGSFGDPGESFVFRAASTTGFENFSLALDAGFFGTAQTRSNTYTVQYALGATPTSFTTLTTLSTDVAVGNTDTTPGYTIPLPAAVNDQASNLVIRIVALAASSGLGSRDTFGIDNFSLTYTAVVVPEPTSLGLLSIGGLAALRRRRA